MFQTKDLRRVSALVVHIWQVILEKPRRKRERTKRDKEKREYEVKEREIIETKTRLSRFILSEKGITTFDYTYQQKGCDLQ